MAAPPGIGGIAAAAPVSAAVPVAALGDPGQESLRRLTALETGKAFQAQVLSLLHEAGVAAAHRHAQDGLLELHGDRAVLTLRGRLLADAVVRDLTD